MTLMEPSLCLFSKTSLSCWEDFRLKGLTLKSEKKKSHFPLEVCKIHQNQDIHFAEISHSKIYNTRQYF